MTASSSLDTLIDLATDQRDTAAVTLGQLQTERLQTHQQLTDLIAYREQYHRELKQALADGLTTAKLANYRRFLVALDQAIAHQRQALSHSEQRVDQGKDQWQSRQRTLQSYDTLAERRRAVLAQREARREQRDNDEYASRMHANSAR